MQYIFVVEEDLPEMVRYPALWFLAHQSVVDPPARLALLGVRRRLKGGLDEFLSELRRGDLRLFGAT